MGKYDDAIGGGKIIVDVEEVLNESSAKKVDKRIKKQKAELAQPVDVNVDTSAAEGKLNALNKSAERLQQELSNAIESQADTGTVVGLINQYHTLEQQVGKVSSEIGNENESLSKVNTTLRKTKQLIDGIAKAQKKSKKDSGAAKSAKKSKDVTLSGEKDKNAEVVQHNASSTEGITSAQDAAQKAVDATTDALKKQGEQIKKTAQAKKTEAIAVEKVAKAQEHAAQTADKLAGAQAKSSYTASRKDSDKWIRFSKLTTTREDVDKRYFDEHGSEVLTSLENRALALADVLQPVDEMVSRISKNSSIKDIPWEDWPKAAAETSKALSKMYDDEIRNTEEYITLQYKLMNLIDAIGKQAGGVRKSGAKNGLQLREWIRNDIRDETGYDIWSEGVVDAIWGQGEFSIFQGNSKKIHMLELAARLQGYQGVDQLGWLDATAEKRELLDLRKAIQSLRDEFNISALTSSLETQNSAVEIKKQSASAPVVQDPKPIEDAAAAHREPTDAQKENEQRISHLKNVIQNQEDWIAYLEKALAKSNFRTSGKKEATEQLRLWSKKLAQHRLNNYENYLGAYPKEMTEVSWMHAYQEAQNQLVADSTLTRYNTDASHNYDTNLQTLQSAYKLSLQSRENATNELRAIQEQIETKERLLRMEQDNNDPNRIQNVRNAFEKFASFIVGNDTLTIDERALVDKYKSKLLGSASNSSQVEGELKSAIWKLYGIPEGTSSIGALTGLVNELKHKYGDIGFEDIFGSVYKSFDLGSENLNSHGAFLGYRALAMIEKAKQAEMLGSTVPEQQAPAVQKLTSSYEGIVEARKEDVKVAEGQTDASEKSVASRQEETKATEEQTEATKEATEAKIKYYDIDEKAARLAKEMRSHWGYEEGSATASYKASVDALAQVAEEKKKQFPDKSEELDRLLDRYSKNLAQFINRDNQIGAQYPSVMVAGPANYNMKKHNRQMVSWGKNYTFYDEKVAALESKIKNFGGNGQVAIRGDEEDTIERLESRLEYMKYWHGIMVEVNKYYRKNKSIEGFDGVEPDELERIKADIAEMKALGMHDVPYPQYRLANDNQNIKRIEGRISSLKQLKSDGGRSDDLQEENEFYKMWTDKQDMRIRISFEMGKPEKEIIDMLRGKAFKWSPKNQAWQRQLTDNALYDAKTLQKALREHYKIVDAVEETASAAETHPVVNEPVVAEEAKQVEKPTSSYEGLAEAVERFHAVNQKTWSAYIHKSPEYQQLIQEREAAIEGIKTLFPDGTPQRQTISDKLKASALKDATGQDLVGFVESNLKEAVGVDSMQKIGGLLDKYSPNDANILFGDISALNIENAKELYDQLLVKEKEYLDSGAKSVTTFAKRNEFLERSVELTEKLKDNERFVGMKKVLTSWVSDGYVPNVEDAIQMLNDGADRILNPMKFLPTDLTSITKWSREFSRRTDNISLLHKFTENLTEAIAGPGLSRKYFLRDLQTLELPGPNDSFLEEFLGEKFINARKNGFANIQFGEIVDIFKPLMRSIEDGGFNGYRDLLQDIQNSFFGDFDVNEVRKKIPVGANSLYQGLIDPFEAISEMIKDPRVAEMVQIYADIDDNEPNESDYKSTDELYAAYMEYYKNVVSVLNKVGKDRLVAYDEHDYNQMLNSLEYYRDEILRLNPNSQLPELFQSVEQSPQIQPEAIPEVIKESADNKPVEVPVKPVVASASVQEAIAESTNDRPVEVPVEPVAAVGSKDSIDDDDDDLDFAPVQMKLPDEARGALLKGAKLEDLLRGYRISGDDKARIQGKYESLAAKYITANATGRDSDIEAMLYNELEALVSDIQRSATKTMSGVDQHIIDGAKQFWELMAGKQFSYTEADKLKFQNWGAASNVRTKGNKKLLSNTDGQTLDGKVYAEILDWYNTYVGTADQKDTTQEQLVQVVQMVARAKELKDAKPTIQAGLGPEDVSALEQQIVANMSVITDNAEQLARKAKEKQNEANQAINAIPDGDSSDDETIERPDIVEKNVEKALERLRNAKDNMTSILDLSSVHSVEDLENQVRTMAQNVFGADLSVDSVIVRDDIARISLYNKELGITAEQVYQLKSATEDAAKVQLEYVSSFAKHSPRQQREYADKQSKQLDKQKQQTAKDDRWLTEQRSKLDTQERKYQSSGKKIDGDTKIIAVDETSLKNESDVTIDSLANHIKKRLSDSFGKGISNELKTEILNDLRVLGNEIKIAQYAEYATTEMTPTKLSEARKELEYTLDTLEAKAKKNNVFSQVSRDLDVLRKKLTDQNASDYIQNATGISDFVSQLRATKGKVSAAIANEQEYKNLEALQDRLYKSKKKLVELETLGGAQSDIMQAQRETQSLEEQYHATVKLYEATEAYTKIKARENQLEAEFSTVQAEATKKRQDADAKQEQADIKSLYNRLLSTTKSGNQINSQLNDLAFKNLGTDAYRNTMISMEGASTSLAQEYVAILQDISSSFNIGLDANIRSEFFRIATEKAALTTEEMQKLNDEFRKADEIGFNFGSKITERIQPTLDKLNELRKLAQDGVFKYSQYHSGQLEYADLFVRDRLNSFKEHPDAFSGMELMQYVDDISEHINALHAETQAELKYFKNKQSYVDGDTVESITRETDALEKLNKTRQELESSANKFAKDSGFDNAFITGFEQSADGISKLNFSVFDKATNSMRNFSMEMGNVTQGMYVTETTVTKSLSSIQAAQKQIQATSDLLVRLGQQGIDIDQTTATGKVATLLQKLQALKNATDSGAEASVLSNLTRDAKISSAELEKLYKKLIQMQNAIDGGEATGLPALDMSNQATVFKQAKDAIQNFASATPNATVEIGKLNEKTGRLPFTITQTDGVMRMFEATIESTTGKMMVQETGVKELGSKWDQFKHSISKIGREFATAFVGFNVFSTAMQQLRQGYNHVKEIDVAMTELKKVTDETAASYENFLDKMAQYGAEVSSTVSALTTSAADWAKLGYSLEDSGLLAKNTSILMNVSEFDNVSQATDALISALQAFKHEGEDVPELSMRIIDAYNQVGNMFPISTSDLAESLTRSSAALVAANNDLSQSIALTAAANSIAQDPAGVGNALKVVSMRIRGVKSELETAGEDTEGMVENTAKLQEQIMALTNIDGKGGVNILTESGAFKSTYEILLDISKIFDKLDDKSSAALLELVAGKNRGSVIAGLLQNGEILEQAYEAAAQSSGSAQQELQTFQDSIAGKTAQLTNSIETMWNNAMSSDFLKWLLDVANTFVKLTDNVGLFGVALGALFTGGVIKAKDDDLFGMFKIFQGGKDGIQFSQKSMVGQLFSGAATGGISGAATAMKTFAASETAAAIGANLLNSALTMGASLLISFIANKAIEAITNYINRMEILREEVEELNKTYKETKKTLSDNIESLTTSSDTDLYSNLTDEFAALARGVDKYGNNISLTSDQYERYKSICEQIVGINPEIASGYDSAARAIGNNVSMLEKLIEAQKTEARLAAKEYVSDDNLTKYSQVTKSEYDSAVKNKQTKIKQAQDKNTSLKYALENVLDGEFYDVKEILRILGYSDTDIEAIAPQYRKDGDSADKFRNFKKFAIDYADELYANRTVLTDHLSQYRGKNPKGVSEAIRAYVEDTVDIDGVAAEAQKQIDEASKQLHDELLEVLTASNTYDDLDAATQNMLIGWIKDSTAFNITDAFKDDGSTMKAWKEQINSMIALLADEASKVQYNGETISMQDLLKQIYELDEADISYKEYLNQVANMSSTLWNAIGGLDNKYGFTDQGQLNIALGLNLDQTEFNQDSEIIAKRLDMEVSEIQKRLYGMGVKEVQAFYAIDWNEVPTDKVQSWQDVLALIRKQMKSTDVVSVETFSDLSTFVEKYNEALAQTSEIVINNTKVTQEYKDSLIELGISEAELNKCFDENNKLVVKDASALNDLLKFTKNNAAQNAQLAKSQARLQYYELYKQMAALVDANGYVVAGNVQRVMTYYAEMNALERTIAKYSLLEAQLLGTSNAFEEFQKAKDFDSQTDYIGSTEEMVVALGKAFNTAELGSETAKAAIAGLVPESVYEHLDTVDEKMAAIYDYFKNGKLAQYFDLSFDEDGNIESAEMKLGNMRKFIEDAMVNGVFNGEDWMHFEFSDTFLKDLENTEDPLQAFADKMKVTKEVALAFIKTMNDHDIEWLNGDYSTLFDPLLASTNEGKIQLYTERLADLVAQQAKLKQQLDSGKIDQTAYDKKIKDIQTKRSKFEQELAAAKTASRQSIFGVGADGTEYAGQADYQIKTSNEVEKSSIENLDNWIELNEKVKQLNTDVTEKQNEYNKALEKYNAELKIAGNDPSKVSKETADAVKEAKKAYVDVTNACADAIAKRDQFAEPTEVEISIALDDIEEKIKTTKQTIDEKLSQGEYTVTVTVDGQTLTKTITSADQLLDECFHIDDDGYWTINAGVNKSELEQKYPEILKYVNFLNSKTTLTAHLNDSSAQITLETLSGQIQKIVDLLDGIKISLDEGSKTTFAQDVQSLLDSLGPLGKVIKIGTKWIGGQYADGTAHVTGTAHKSGDWGLPTDEHNALVGELGEELVVDPQSGRYYTVGTNGAEMVNLKRGSIIFNHKQTEGLLKNGHIASRGKAYAEGNAHVTIWPQGSSKTEWEGTGYDDWLDQTYNLIDALDDVSDAAKDAASEFKEAMDWIEVRMEELDETLGKLNAQLENTVGYAEQNKKIAEIISTNNTKYANASAGAAYYEKYAQQYYNKIPTKYRDAAKNGAISITDFKGKANEKVVEAIQNYRDYVQKAADLRQTMEELITENADLAKQKFDNVATQYENEIGLIETNNEQLEAKISLMEDSGEIASPKYYEQMIENTKQMQTDLAAEKKLLKDVLDAEVQAGRIEVGSDRWYDMVNALYDVDAQIQDCVSDLESFQNAINEIYWDNFDELISRVDYLKDDAQGLIDLLEKDDMVAKPNKRKHKGGTVEFWTEDDVKWTEEGIATMGLLAQQMEMAEFKSRQYAEAIDDLEVEYAAGKYSESEYLEKLNELTQAQYDSIESYYDAQDAIVELNEARIDSIKEGIEAEIEAYEELIDKKKEALSTEKDLYDFQRGVAEQQKSIAQIERQLAALATDSSMSAAAKRKQLEAELATARQELEDTYYDRSVENRQNALDKELEDFQTEKDIEMKKWEEYLTNVESIVAESLTIVQANAAGIYDVLNSKAQEYDLTLSPALTTPWEDGALAVWNYQEQFDTSMSSTMDQLESLKTKWQEVIDKMVEYANTDISNQHVANEAVITTPKVPEAPAPAPDPSPSNPNENTSSAVPVAVGGTATVKKTATHFSSLSKNLKMASFVPGGKYTVYETSGSGNNMQVLLGRNGVYTGWVKLTDLEGYAKGSKGIEEDQWAMLDELGEELVIHAGKDGRVEYLTKGSGVLTHDLTERLMNLAMNPQDVLDRSRPQFAPSNSVVNNTMEIKIDASVGELIHVDHLDGNNPAEISKVIDKAWEKKMQTLNNAVRRFTR